LPLKRKHISSPSLLLTAGMGRKKKDEKKNRA
jgi:hypothetical protein